MACGCQNTCGCTIVGDNVTAVVVEGPAAGTFTVSSIQTIMGVAATDCIQLEIDEDRILTATPILADGEAVDLSCTEDGLLAELVIDPASSAIVTQSDDGLRVDIPPFVGGGDCQPGDLILHFGVGPRLGAIDADGSEVLRGDYPALWDALSLFATDADRAVGVDTISGIGSTRFMAPGMVVEATSFPLGTTIVSVDSSTQITVSDPATNSGSDTEVRVYPHGAGNGTTTFNVPDGNKVFPLGFDYQGGTNVLGDIGGSFDATLTPGSLPLHDHPATSNSVVTDPGHDHPATGADSGHAHGIDPSGNHQHDGAGANHDFLVENTSPVAYVYLHVDAVNVDTAGTMRFTSNGFEGGDSYKPNREGLTFPDGNHAHGGSTDPGNAVITVDVQDDVTGITVATTTDVGDAGSATPDPVDVTPPYNVVRWMVQT